MSICHLSMLYGKRIRIFKPKSELFIRVMNLLMISSDHGNAITFLNRVLF